jgi:hypothetical protein
MDITADPGDVAAAQLGLSLMRVFVSGDTAAPACW